MEYTVNCPIHKNHEVEFNFASNNGYVGICNNEDGKQYLLYYCSILGKVTVFSRDGSEPHIDLSWDEFNRIERERMAAAFMAIRKKYSQEIKNDK